ncbi:MAG: cupin domain-containing protein [Patescibacteria group bacterium]
MPSPFIGDIMSLAKANPHFRQEITTATHAQITLMSIPPGGEVGEETHTDNDQTLLFITGTGKAIVEGQETLIAPGFLALIPVGTRHNFLNTGTEDMKIVSVYAPPHHPVGTIQHTKADADAAEAAGK